VATEFFHTKVKYEFYGYLISDFDIIYDLYAPFYMGRSWYVTKHVVDTYEISIQYDSH
jgi:hypothetical protein